MTSSGLPNVFAGTVCVSMCCRSVRFSPVRGWGLATRALVHAMEDPLVPSNERSGFPQGIVAPGRRKDGGEPSGFILGQLGGGLSEVMPCRRLGSVYPHAPFRNVEIQLEDALLRQMLLQRAGNERFLRLSEHRSIGREVEIFCELLRDRAAAALEGALFEVVQRGVLHPFPIETFMGEKRCIFGRDDGAA